MKRMKRSRSKRESGFSLVEMLIVVAILLIVMGAVFSQIKPLQTRATSEASKVESFQSGREAVEQFTRDLHQTGYPNTRMYAAGVLASATQDSRVAVGLVQATATNIIFEGDVDGDGTVDSVQYRIVAADAALSASCPCLERSQQPKINGDPLAGQLPPSWSVLVENAIMPQAGPPLVPAVFQYYANDGSNPATLALTKAVRINLTAQTATTAGGGDISGARPMSGITATARITN